MSSYLDSLIFGIRDVFDKLGARLPTRTALQFLGAVTLEDDPENRRTIVRVEGGGPATELDGEVTGPASATVVAKVGGADVAFDHEDSGHLTLENGKIVAREPPTPGIESVATLAALRAIPSAGLGAELRFVEETGILWRYEPASGANEIDDGAVSVKPTDKAQAEAGRWRPVTLPELPALEPVPGMTIPTAHVGASLIVMGAKPIRDGQPSDASMFNGFLVDMGDEAGVKRPYGLIGFSLDGFQIGSLNMATMQSEEIVSLWQRGIHFAPGGRHEIRIRSGHRGHGASDVSLDIVAGDRGDGDADGTLTLRGGGWGATMVLEGGTSGGNATISAQGDATISAQGDATITARGDVTISAGVDKTAIINGLVARVLGGSQVEIATDGGPVIVISQTVDGAEIGFNVKRIAVTGSRSDGSAWESLLNALVALGLVEDQTTP